MKGVFEVNYLEDFIISINSTMAKIKLILASSAIILLIVVVILIHNTLKLATYSQRFLIKSMQLIGTTANFIRKPFLSR